MRGSSTPIYEYYWRRVNTLFQKRVDVVELLKSMDDAKSNPALFGWETELRGVDDPDEIWKAIMRTAAKTEFIMLGAWRLITFNDHHLGFEDHELKEIVVLKD